VIREAGLPRRRRRYWGDVQGAPAADRCQFTVISGHYDTRFGGLFLFVKDLCELQLAQATAALPADCMIRSLLAL